MAIPETRQGDLMLVGNLKKKKLVNGWSSIMDLTSGLILVNKKPQSQDKFSISEIICISFNVIFSATNKTDSNTRLHPENI